MWKICRRGIKCEIQNKLEEGAFLFVRIKPWIEITITCKYKQYQEIIDHTEKNTRDQDLTWFTQTLGYAHQIESPIFYDPMITT